MSLVGVLTGWFRDLDFIAEDLGYPSPEVVQLLSDSGLPGMKVLEFAFDSRDPSDYLPHSCNFNSICYTGTHDNAPLTLWRTETDKADIAFAKKYLGLNDEEGFNAGIIRGGMSCQSRLFVAQMQDYLGLGKGCRMNTPGTSSGNWQWRMLSGEASKKLAKSIHETTRIYGRHGFPRRNKAQPLCVVLGIRPKPPCFVIFRQNITNCIYFLTEKESWVLPCSHFFNSQE